MSNKDIESLFQIYKIGKVIYQSGELVTYGNSTTETNLTPPSVAGELTIPANLILLNSKLKIKLAGTYSTPVGGGGILTFKIKLTDVAGTVTTLITTATSALAVSAVTKQIQLESELVLRTLTTMTISGGIYYNGTVFAYDSLHNLGATISVDFGKIQTLSVTATWDTADAAKILTINQSEIILIA